jgi:hypothetical protein
MRRWTLKTRLQGHHWCDHCDENAYGPVCRACRNPARWVPNHAPHTARMTVKTLETIPPAEWFERMREQISHVKTP